MSARAICTCRGVRRQGSRAPRHGCRKQLTRGGMGTPVEAICRCVRSHWPLPQCRGIPQAGRRGDGKAVRRRKSGSSKTVGGKIRSRKERGRDSFAARAGPRGTAHSMAAGNSGRGARCNNCLGGGSGPNEAAQCGTAAIRGSPAGRVTARGT